MGLSNRDRSSPGLSSKGLSSEGRPGRVSSAGHDGAGSHPVEPGLSHGWLRLRARLIGETERYMASLLALYRWEEEPETRRTGKEDR